MNRNKVLLIGYVGREVITTLTRKGGKRAAIRLATHHRHPDKNGKITEHTSWHNIVAWNRIASIAENSFIKGSKMLVEGTIDYCHFMGKDGPVTYTQIKAHTLINLDR